MTVEGGPQLSAATHRMRTKKKKHAALVCTQFRDVTSGTYKERQIGGCGRVRSRACSRSAAHTLATLRITSTSEHSSKLRCFLITETLVATNLRQAASRSCACASKATSIKPSTVSAAMRATVDARTPRASLEHGRDQRASTTKRAPRQAGPTPRFQCTATTENSGTSVVRSW